MTRPARIFVSAGEASGDIILGAVLERLRRALPDMELAGLGGPWSRAQGLEPLFPMARTAFSGAGDALLRLPFALRLYLAAAGALRRFRPDLVLLVDYPGLNLRLARIARSLGIPVHFIAPPQAWAYRNPARKLRRARAALEGCSVQPLYAFEAGDWRAPGSEPVQGHFQDTVSPGLPKDGPALFCPGSRPPVLRRNLPAWLRLLDAAGIAPATPFDVLVPPFLADEAARLIAAAPAGVRRAGHRVRADAGTALAAAPRAIAFPGTITLELARHRVPTLVLAVLDPLTYLIGRKALAGRRLALPNLILGEDLFPEWAGPLPGPDPARFRALWDGLPGTGDIDWDRRLADLAGRMGPGDGAGKASEACLRLLRPGSERPGPARQGRPEAEIPGWA